MVSGQDVLGVLNFIIFPLFLENVNTKILREMRILLPSQNIQNQYSELVKGNDTLLINLEKKNENLRQTRDLLLPRLISGALDVSEMEIEE